jgi:hypothetical protein
VERNLPPTLDATENVVPSEAGSPIPLSIPEDKIKADLHTFRNVCRSAFRLRRACRDRMERIELNIVYVFSIMSFWKIWKQ